METNKKMYRVTIHEHTIYDSFIEAVSQAEAEEIAELQIIEEESTKWRQDYNAGWIEIGDIYEDKDGEWEEIDA